ncbi:M23 family metallopeptidase [Lederbergia wuyishanensis]|uniref:Murein DD-endopeptidase MepM/ murein hydrolase activator NlpD n=1 Tax=Lederbergia wuyishanensis TaxID=1347903 RepID=A0ABU0D9D3_9BACI|nr:M23 family metallopeptidase [Lederbergia wuyishanensis]MCJ8009440.1 M23 family metallopeptidase [Lederbergia wuyishanensis]MDQ0344950.1 murein DD-endopeptidase MepM/ murein hydrolase activator NlpD [Lederbergia wuyishanensis]
MKKLFPVIFLFFFLPLHAVDAKELSQKEIFDKRMHLYKSTEATTGVPWYYIAAVDQFERSIRYVRKDLPKPDDITGYYVPPKHWAGPLNPFEDDSNPLTITFFNGIGIDGNGDGRADRSNGKDLLYTMATYLSQYGVNDQAFRIAIWDYYKRDQTVRSIMTNAQVYRKFKRIDLDEKAFPIPKGYNYTYKNTWGDRRGWGGRRIHEGTDIFAGYGAPVRAVAYGVVELKGWNKYGGWRVGIRDLNNTYHYYAHLNGFSKELKIGDIVAPGQIIGSVGSSGYGPPGTSGKFPPHLHFGMYKDNGKNEWSFDPYPHLRLWEQQERIRRNKK